LVGAPTQFLDYLYYSRTKGRVKGRAVFNHIIIKMENIIIKKSEIHGIGLFANKNFKQGELILKVDLSKLPKFNPKKISKQEELHIDYAGRGRYVISYHPYVYINHSCDPNVLTKHLTIAKSEFYAIRDIRRSEELTYDYGVNAMDQIDKETWRTKCTCGAKNCRKILSTCFLKQPIEIQKKYYKYLPLSLKRKYKNKFLKLK
jgi:SET domain-containing protein